MTKSKFPPIISIFLAIFLTVYIIYVFREGIFKLTPTKNLIYTVFFTFFYAIAFFFIPFKILLFADSIQKNAQTLDFETGEGNTKNVFSKIFQNYKKTFLTEQDDILGANGKTRTNADLYFNADELCEARFLFPIFPMMKIITGTFVGLGILGTFIGFSAAVPDGDITKLEDLDELIKGLKTAFNTSIVGVFSSVFYNFLIVQPLIKLLNQNSKLLSDRLDEQYFVTDVASMEKMSAIVKETLTTVQSNTKELAKNFKDSSAEMFSEAIAQGKDALNREMNGAAMKLSEISEILKDTPEKIAALNEKLEESIQNSTEQTKVQLSLVVETINKNLNEKFKDFTENLKPVSENLKTYAEQISTTTEKIQSLPEKISEIHSSFSSSENELVSKIQDISSSLRDSVSAMENSYDTIQEAIRNIRSAMQTSKEQIDLLIEKSKLNNEEASKNLADAISQYNTISGETKAMLSGFLQVDKSLKSIFDQIKNQFENYSTGIAANLTHFMDGFANGTKEYTSAFRISSDELKNALEDLQPMIENLQASEEKLELLPEKIGKILAEKIEAAGEEK